jgi:predicted restriction endonuclease
MLPGQKVSALTFAACLAHDVAFDTGLLSVNGGLRIRQAALSQSARKVRTQAGGPPALV